MVRSPLTDDLADLLQNAPELNFEIPNPEDEELPEFEFNQRVETAWVVCDRFDLQTDIWRGRILRAVRDREKKGGEGRGKGFLNWLKDREISKSQAYALIELANSADTLLAEGKLQPEAINNFSKRAFIETAQSPLQVQQLVSEAATGGDRITRREVKQLTDEWVAMTSDLLPEEVKEKAADRSLPPKHVAPLVRELEKLPESHQQEIQRAVAESPDIDTVKQLTSDARNLSKYLDAAAQVQTIDPNIIDLELALEEALRIGCLNVAADLVKQSAQLEQTAVKLYTTWKRLAGIADRLYVDTGASTPNLRSLITCIERITGSIVEVPLDDSKERTVRLQILTE